MNKIFVSLLDWFHGFKVCVTVNFYGIEKTHWPTERKFVGHNTDVNHWRRFCLPHIQRVEVKCFIYLCKKTKKTTNERLTCGCFSLCFQDRYFSVLCVWRGPVGKKCIQSAELHHSYKVVKSITLYASGCVLILLWRDVKLL